MVAWVSTTAFESLAVSTAMPTVATDLDGLRQYTLAFSIAAAAAVLGMAAAGPWADRRGPAAPMAAGAATVIVGALTSALAPTMSVLLVGRLLQGLGGGLTDVALLVLVARTFPVERHARVFASFAAAWVLPGVVGPLVAGLVVENAGWRWVFGGVLVIGLPALALLVPGLAATRRRAEADVAPERRASAPVVRSVVRAALTASRGLGAAVLIRMLSNAAFATGEVLIPLALTHERGLPPAAAGSVLTLHVLGWAVGSQVRGRSKRGTPAGFVRLAGLALAVGFGGVALVAADSVPLWLAAAPWAVAGLGMGILTPTTSLLALELAPSGGQGAASSAMQVASALAAALVLTAVGPLLWALHAQIGLAAYAVVFGAAGAAGLVIVGQASRTRATR